MPAGGMTRRNSSTARCRDGKRVRFCEVPRPRAEPHHVSEQVGGGGRGGRIVWLTTDQNRVAAAQPLDRDPGVTAGRQLGLDRGPDQADGLREPLGVSGVRARAC